MEEKRYEGWFYKQGSFSPVQDLLAPEVSLSISINEIPFTITMHTPGNERELVRGLLFTEGIYQDLKVQPGISIVQTNVVGYPTKIDVQIPEGNILKEFSGTRNMTSVSSCGICGKTELEDISSVSFLQEDGTLDASLVEKMFEQMRSHQTAFDQSGGTHAAAAFDLLGELLIVKEDIGRHNAVDKVIGSLIYYGKLAQTKFLAVSGRISYEIVSKAFVAGIPFLGSVSAPSTLAVETAANAGMTLLAFCRNDKLTVYTHPERMMPLEK
jgi:FdhD protein